MGVLSLQPLKSDLKRIVKVTPPSPQEEPKCKNAQFLEYILKDDDVYFQQLQHLKFGWNSFIVKSIGF